MEIFDFFWPTSSRCSRHSERCSKNVRGLFEGTREETRGESRGECQGKPQVEPHGEPCEEISLEGTNCIGMAGDRPE